MTGSRTTYRGYAVTGTAALANTFRTATGAVDATTGPMLTTKPPLPRPAHRGARTDWRVIVPADNGSRPHRPRNAR